MTAGTLSEGYLVRRLGVTWEVVMFAVRQRSEPIGAEANRFLFQVEQEFDLMRLKARRAILEQEEKRLAEEQEALRNERKLAVVSIGGSSEAPPENGRMKRWGHAVATRAAIWRLGFRREGLAEEVRRLVVLEEDIAFALRLSRRRALG
jgi:hypothetical protein